jgi:3-ketosteroid 9alpha-monooxygenase subunit A
VRRHSLTMAVTGWFQVGWSGQLPPGECLPLRYFGTELVAWRGESGRFLVADAYCPHLGAHLGYGGVVTGECIRCPMHGWEWDESGGNESIPYRSVPDARRLRLWDARDVGGILYIWHDAAGRPPLFEPPDVFEVFADGLTSEDFYFGYPIGATKIEAAPVHPQFLIEDRVDRDHFIGVHHSPRPDLDPIRYEEFRMASDLRLAAGACGVDSYNYGLSITCFRYWGADDERSVVCATPVDDEVCDVFHTVWISKDFDGDATDAQDPARFQTVKEHFHNDLRVMSHLRYTELVEPIEPNELNLARLREWTRRFYPCGDTAP